MKHLPVAAQFAGGASVLAGVVLLWGLAVALIVLGLSVVALATLKEAGII